MKRNLKILTILSLVAVLLAFAGCGAGKTANKEPAKNYTLPEAVADVRDQAMDYVQDYAKKLEGGWTTAAELRENWDMLETWTQIALNGIDG